MPVHDWGKVDAGTFHAFHNAWNTHLMGTLNGGILPDGYYALAEQHVRGRVPDVLTFHVPGRDAGQPPLPTTGNRGIAVADSPPRVHRKLVADESSYRARQRTLTIRNSSGHQVVALLEIVSPGNKDRAASVSDFVEKVVSVLNRGIHVLVVDLFRPVKHEPGGMHAQIWSSHAIDGYDPPPDRPLTLSSYVANDDIEAYVEHLSLGEPLAEMPLFLNEGTYISVPLERTYLAAFADMPGFWREVLEQVEGNRR